MTITTITDCKDSNAFGRQSTRLHSLFNINPIEVGINNDIEAAGNLIDILDSLKENKGIIIVNVAPRQGKSKKWNNGTPFCYFYIKNKLIISSIQGFTLSLIKELKLTNEICLLDIVETASELMKKNIITGIQASHIKNTQFRSFDYLPFVAKYLSEYKELINIKVDISEINNLPDAVWWIDNFGNCKTTIRENKIRDQSWISTKFGKLKVYKNLKDVPDAESAAIVGSSGLYGEKFVELVVQGKSFAKEYGVFTGDALSSNEEIELTKVN